MDAELFLKNTTPNLFSEKTKNESRDYVEELMIFLKEDFFRISDSIL